MNLKLTNFWENFEPILNWLQKNDEYSYTLYAYPVAELDENFYDTLVRLIVDKFRDNDEFNQLFVGYREDFRLELKSLLNDGNFYEQTVDRMKVELIGQKHPATDVIWGTLTDDIVDENVYENATKKLRELYGRNIGNSADWSSDAWLVKVVYDSQYVIINDESSDKFEFFKATWNLENEENDIEVLYTVEYDDINELIQFVTDYDFTNQTDNDLPEIVNIIFDKDATIEKADGDTIIVATLSNDDELTFYVGNSGNIEFIEENGVEKLTELSGKYDAEILEFFNQNEDEIMNTFNEMNTGDLSKRTFTGIHGETWNVELMNFANLIPGETKLTFKCISEEIGRTVYVSFLDGEYLENYDEDEDETDIDENTKLIDELESWANEFDFEPIDTRKELKKSNNKKAIPSNVLEWCKDGNGYHVFEELKQLATWLNKLTGRNFVGGTSIGKSPQTLILDITYQGSEVYVNSDEIKLKGEIVENYKEFKTVFEKHFKIIG